MGLFNLFKSEPYISHTASVKDFPGFVPKWQNDFTLFYWPDIKKFAIFEGQWIILEKHVEYYKHNGYIVSFSVDDITKVVFLPGNSASFPVFSFNVKNYGTILIEMSGGQYSNSFKSVLTSKM